MSVGGIVVTPRQIGSARRSCVRPLRQGVTGRKQRLMRVRTCVAKRLMVASTLPRIVTNTLLSATGPRRRPISARGGVAEQLMVVSTAAADRDAQASARDVDQAAAERQRFKHDRADNDLRRRASRLDGSRGEADRRTANREYAADDRERAANDRHTDAADREQSEEAAEQGILNRDQAAAD